MSLAEMGRVARRRWYILLPLLLLAVVATVGVERSIPRQYQSTGMVSLLASPQSIKGTSTVPGTENPFLSFDSSLNDTADFLVRRLSSTDAAQQLAGEGVGTYTAVLAASQGPFIQLTANGATPKAARDAMTALIAYTSTQLNALQDEQGVPRQNMITSAVIVPGSPPTALNKRRVQDTLGAGAAALALAILATFATDSIALRRRRKHGRRKAGRSTAGPAAALSTATQATMSTAPGAVPGGEPGGLAEQGGADGAGAAAGPDDLAALPVRRRSAERAERIGNVNPTATANGEAGADRPAASSGELPGAAAGGLTGELISPLSEARD